MNMAPRCRGKAVEIILTTSFLIIRFKFLDCNVKRASSELLKKKIFPNFSKRLSEVLQYKARSESSFIASFLGLLGPAQREEWLQVLHDLETVTDNWLSLAVKCLALINQR